MKTNISDLNNQMHTLFKRASVKLCASVLYFSLSQLYPGEVSILMSVSVPAKPVKHWGVGFGHIVEEQVQLECVRGSLPEIKHSKGHCNCQNTGINTLICQHSLEVICYRFHTFSSVLLTYSHCNVCIMIISKNNDEK